MNRQDNPPTSQTAYPSGHYGYPTAPDFQEGKPINWRRFFFLFLRNWPWFLITLGLALSIAFFKIKYTIPRYQASATLIIEEDENSQDLLNELRSVRFWRRQSVMSNERAKMSSFTTIKRTVDSLLQDVSWTAHGRIRVRKIYENPRYQLTLFNDTTNWFKGQEWYIDYLDDESFRFYKEDFIDTIFYVDSLININNWQFSVNFNGRSGHQTYSFVIIDPIEQTKQYKQKLNIETDKEAGTLMKLTSTGPVGEREVDFLNKLSQIYILSGLERKRQIAENTTLFIDEQIELILDSLNEAENQLLTFRLTNNVINLSREGEIAYDRLKSFHEQRTILKLKENYYNYLYDYIEKRNDPQTIIAPTLSDAGDQLLNGAVLELQSLYEERENLGISAMIDNPGFENINTRIKSIRIRILEIVKGLTENNRLTQGQVDTEEQALIDQLKTLPLNEQQLLNIKRKYDLYSQFYTYLLEKRAEAGIQKASTISNVRLLDPARNDQIISLGTDKMIVFFIAFLIGILLPAIILLLRNQLDNRIQEYEDILHNTNIPIIGVIGHALGSGSLPVDKEASSSFTEFLRRIRTNLTFALKEKESKVIMVTSSISGEGKSFSAANLAAIIAMNHKKVLLLGCDLRKPSLHKTFNISNEIGVTSYLIGSKQLNECIFPTSIEGLFVLPAGPVPPNPAELIETEEMKNLFIYSRKEFDYIIIDTPPIALVADALSIATYSDITLYLVRQNHSHKSVLEIANSLKREEKLPNIYLLINDMKPSKNIGFDYYYGYGQMYKYGYYSYNKDNIDND